MSRRRTHDPRVSRAFKSEAAATTPVLAIAGGKGGSGTTTTASLLAWMTSRETLLVDADWRAPDATRRAGHTPGWADGAEDGRRPPTPEPRPPDWPGGPTNGRCLPAPAGTGRTHRIDRLCRAERWPDRQVIVDCPSSVYGTTARVLRLADRALVTTLPTEASVRAARKTVRQARAAGTPIVGCVVVGRDRGHAAPDDALDPPTLARIPAVDCDPLASAAVRSASRTVAERLFGPADRATGDRRLGQPVGPFGTEHRS